MTATLPIVDPTATDEMRYEEITKPLIATELLGQMIAQFAEPERPPRETIQGMPAVERPPFATEGSD